MRNRGKLYAQEKKREELKVNAASLLDFFKSLNVNITISKAKSFDIPIISQLTLKPNQFNLTTRRDMRRRYGP